MSIKRPRMLLVGYISGVWDLLHIGHIRVLKRAKALCDVLVVGVNTDENVVSYKGKPPIIPYRQRREIIESLRYVDAVVSHTSFEDTTGFDDYEVNMRIVSPEFGQYAEQTQVLSKHCKEGIKIVVLARTPNISVTAIKEAICEDKNIIDNRDGSCSHVSELWREETGTPDLCYNSG